MSVGRYIMRGRVFQPRVFAGWGLANGGAIVITAPTAGWTAGTQERHWIARTQQRFFISSSQQRLWTSEVSQ
jgi:hypothetical protein